MKGKLTKLFKRLMNSDCLAHSRSIVVDFLADTNLIDELEVHPTNMVSIEIAGREILIKSKDYCTIACLLAKGNKIPAVKMLRTITQHMGLKYTRGAGVGLIENKDAVCNVSNWPIDLS